MADPVLVVEALKKSYLRQGAAYGSLRDSLHTLFRGGRRDPMTHVQALDDVSFDLPRGACLGVIGANGAGKSTLLKVIARITPPDGGRLEVRGRVSALIEVGAGFHPELTGRENVLLHGSILGFRRREITRRLPEIVTFAGLEDAMDVPVKYFSTGMYARLGFAVAVHADPDLLLVDEVLSVGDEAFRERCYARVAAMQEQGTSILFVSHDLEAVSRLCAEALWFDGGRVRARGLAAGITEDYLAAMRP